MATDSTVRTRRAVLGAALGGAAAVAATAVAKPLVAQAADAGTAIIGAANESNTVTSFKNLDPDEVSLAGLHDGAGTGVEGMSVTGPGLVGLSTDTTPTTDWDVPSRKTGVWGAAGDTTLAFSNTDEAGVFGFADVSANSGGVVGQSSAGTGVAGVGDTGVFGRGYWGVYGMGQMGVVGDAYTDETGVYGYTGTDPAPTPPGGVGVYARAQSTSQYALRVEGRVYFNRSGRTSFSSSATSKKITLAGVTSSSYVIATMQTNVSGLYVRSVVCGTGYFYIYLSKAPGKTAYVGYLVIK